jgi:hypothetical protein
MQDDKGITRRYTKTVERQELVFQEGKQSPTILSSSRKTSSRVERTVAKGFLDPEFAEEDEQDEQAIPDTGKCTQ